MREGEEGGRKHFLFAVKNGQFEDLETPAHKILLDDSIENNSEKNKEDVK